MKKILSLLAVFFMLACLCYATVTDTESPVKVYTSATVTAYPIPFDYIDDTDIEVTLVAIATGAETAQTLNVDYTIVSDTVTYSVAPGAAYKIIIRRVTPYTQEASWVSGSAPPLSAYESAFDKLTFLTQDLDERMDRSLKLPIASAVNPELPDPSLHPGELLRINLAGDGFDSLAVAAAGVYPDFTAYCDPADLTSMRQHKYQALGNLQRSKFTYVNSTTITIGPGVYDICGGSYWQTVFWGSDITFTNTDTTTGWKYLYIDDSTLTSAPSILTASNFTVSTTPPAWSTLLPRRGWYNGNDRCIFAYYVWSTNAIWPFYHDGGDLVQYMTQLENRAPSDINAAEYVTLTMPHFSTKGQFTVLATLNGAYYVYASVTTTNYAAIGCGISGATVSLPLFTFHTNANQQINIELNDYTGTNLVSVRTHGFFFPTGM
ncbi:MAG: hypothetical protein ABFD81_06605 [Syntrophaceae bacterium]